MKKIITLIVLVLTLSTSCKYYAPDATYELFDGLWLTDSDGAPSLTFVSEIRMFTLQYITADPMDFEVGEFSVSGDMITMNNLSTNEVTTHTFKFSDNNNKLKIGNKIYYRQILEQ